MVPPSGSSADPRRFAHRRDTCLGERSEMFEGLSKRLGDVFDKLRGRGALSEADVDAALREVRTALLEADVALPVVRQFIDGVRPKAIGADVIRSVTPGQMVVKIVNDHLVEMLGGTVADLDLNAIPPVVILMVGLQGSGKTTSSAKIGYRLSQGPQGMAAEFGGSFSVKRKVMMASLDTRRPAAQQQLKILGEQTGVPTLPIVPLEMPLAITKRALETARREGFDVLILDTAGRLSIDEELMKEVADISALAQPQGDAARRRRHDRPGRGQRRQGLQRSPRRHRHRADARGRRCARWRCALDARRHRPPGQADRRRREVRCAGAVPSRPHRRPHPRHGRHRLAGRARRRDDREGRRREARGQGPQGPVRHGRPAEPAPPAAQDGRPVAA